jgi:hypothetical protein
MKKSEVIEYLLKNGRCQISDIQAIDVLRMLDDMGFLPPRIKLDKLKVPDNGYESEETLYGDNKL